MNAFALQQKIGNNIRRLRLQKGIDNSTFAVLLQKTEEYIEQLEEGQLDLPLSTLANIAQVLKTRVIELIDHDYPVSGQAHPDDIVMVKASVLNRLIAYVTHLNKKIVTRSGRVADFSIIDDLPLDNNHHT